MYEVKHYVCSMCFFFSPFFYVGILASGCSFLLPPPPQTRNLMSFTMNRFLFFFLLDFFFLLIAHM